MQTSAIGSGGNCTPLVGLLQGATTFIDQLTHLLVHNAVNQARLTLNGQHIRSLVQPPTCLRRDDDLM